MVQVVLLGHGDGAESKTASDRYFQFMTYIILLSIHLHLFSPIDIGYHRERSSGLPGFGYVSLFWLVVTDASGKRVSMAR